MRLRSTAHHGSTRPWQRHGLGAVVVFTATLIISASTIADEPPAYWFREWTLFDAPKTLPHDDVRAIEVTHDAVWVGTRGGLARLRNDQSQQWREAEGLPSSWISAIAYDDSTHDVWIGTWGSGLVRYTAGRFDAFNQLNSGLSGNMVFSLALDGRRVWAATNGGISTFDPSRDTWALYEAKRADRAQEAFTSLAFDGRYLWTTAWCGPLRSMDVNQVDLEEAPNSARFNATIGMIPSYSFAHGAKRHAWATPFGIRAFDANSACILMSFDVNLLAPSSIVHCMTITPDDVVWAGCGDGLIAADLQGNTAVHYRLDGNATLYRCNNPVETRHIDWMLPSSAIRCLAADDDSLWIGTDAGLVRARSRIAWEDIPKVRAASRSTLAKPTTSQTSRAADEGPASSRPPHHADMPTIDIAVLGPTQQTIGLPGESNAASKTSKRGDSLAVQLAIRQINADGSSPRQRRYDAATVSAGYDRYGWTTPEDEFHIFAERPNVVGIIGEIAPENGVANYVVLQSEVPMVNTSSRSRAEHERLNPWIFRCPRNDYDTHQRLLDTAALAAKGNRFAIVRVGDVEEEAHLAMWRLAAARSDAGIMGEATWMPDDDQAMRVFDALLARKPDVILTWCDAKRSASILQHADAAGWRGAFVGSDWIVCDEFADIVGDTQTAVFAIKPGSKRPTRTNFQRFVDRYARQSSPVGQVRAPTAAAIANYDATLLMREAIEAAGPDRDAVRATLGELSRPAIVRLKSNVWQSVETRRASAAARPTKKPTAARVPASVR